MRPIHRAPMLSTSLPELLPSSSALSSRPALPSVRILALADPGEVTLDQTDVLRPDWAEVTVERGYQGAATEGGSTEELIARLRALLNSPGCPDGIVVTHPTSTLEDVAYWLSLVLDTYRPVIFTGALRPTSALGADGARNVLDAVRVAAAAGSAARGVLVVMNGEIHAAREVCKIGARFPGAFQSLGAGPVGCVEGARVCFTWESERFHTQRSQFAGCAVAELPRVEVLASYHDVGREALDAALRAGARGLVLCEPVTPVLLAGLREAVAQGVTVLLATPSGRGTEPVEERLEQSGLISSGDLTPRKARILLRLALAQGMGREAIVAALRSH